MPPRSTVAIRRQTVDGSCGPTPPIAACLNKLGLDLGLAHWHPSHLLLNSLTPLDVHPLRSPQNPIL